MFPWTRPADCPNRLGARGCAPCTASGLLSGTPVRTRGGYIPAEALTEAHEIAIFPHGFRRPDRIDRHEVFLHPAACPGCTLPFLIPEGALGIHGPRILQHEARLLIGDARVRTALGTPWMSVAVADLTGFRGIAPCAPVQGTLTSPVFAEEVFIALDDGLHLCCPPEMQPLAAPLRRHRVAPLTSDQADVWLALMETEGPLPS